MQWPDIDVVPNSSEEPDPEPRASAEPASEDGAAAEPLGDDDAIVESCSSLELKYDEEAENRSVEAKLTRKKVSFKFH